MTTTKKIIQSFIIVPLVATTLSMNTFTASINQAVSTMTATEQATVTPEDAAKQAVRETKASKIDAYYAKYDLPLAGYGMSMVIAAEKYGIDPYLIAGLAMRESTGCKFIIKSTYNCFGWGGGKIKFQSFDHAIDTVAMNLGGHNERTARYYKGKTLRGILQTYNPPSVVATYADEVIAIMNRIDKIIV